MISTDKQTNCLLVLEVFSEAEIRTRATEFVNGSGCVDVEGDLSVFPSSLRLPLHSLTFHSPPSSPDNTVWADVPRICTVLFGIVMPVVLSTIRLTASTHNGLTISCVLKASGTRDQSERRSEMQRTIRVLISDYDEKLNHETCN
jgi:hypothetical protein